MADHNEPRGVKVSEQGIHDNMTESNNLDDTIRWGVACYVIMPPEVIAAGQRAISKHIRTHLEKAAHPGIAFRYAVERDDTGLW